jgi:hypothetical protein
MRRLAVLLAALCAAPALAQDGPPSGHSPELFDLVLEPAAGIARFRFLLPDLAAIGQPAVADDFLWLCGNYALPELAAEGWSATMVVISYSDRAIPLGDRDPTVTQYFEGFSVMDGTCIWEPY